MKKFIAGLIIGVLLTGSIAFAASNLTAVKSAFVTSVNGKTVKQDIVTINGEYYSNLKQLAGNLGIKYKVDTKGKKLILGEAPAVNTNSRSNPAPVGKTQTLTSQAYTADITVKEIVRGDKVKDLITKAESKDFKLEAGYEYLFAKVKFHLKNTDENRSIFVVNVSFALVSEKGSAYEPIKYAELPAETLNSALNKGQSAEGWVIFKVKTEDKKPLITYGGYDGAGSLWFKGF